MTEQDRHGAARGEPVDPPSNGAQNRWSSEAVAAEVPSVVEVREELTIRGITEGERPDRP